MRNRLWFLTLTLFTVLTLVLASCGPGENVANNNGAVDEPDATEEPMGDDEEEEPPMEEEEPTEAPAAGDRVTIRITTWAGVEETTER